MAGINMRTAAPGMTRLAAALGGGGYQRAYDNELGLQSKLAQALASAEKDNAAAEHTRTETGILQGRGDVADEMLARAAGTTVPMVRAQRHRLNGTQQGSATGDPETDAMIGISSTPEVSSAVAQALDKHAPRFAAFRTNVKDMKPDDLAAAAQIYRQGDLSDDIIAGRTNRNTVAGAQAAAAGKDMFSSDNSGAVLDRFTGGLDTNNPMAGSAINLRNQQAGQAKAAAAENYAQADSARATATKTRSDMNRDARGGDVSLVTRPDGAVWRVNKVTGQAQPVVDSAGNAVSAAPKGGGGKGGGGNVTEGERKAGALLMRLRGSQQQLMNAVGGSPDAIKPGMPAEFIRHIAGDTAANLITPEARQQVEAAQLDMLDAALTLGTGAAYTREQLEGYRRSYFPQIGDNPKAVRDKQVRLANVIRAAEVAAGRVTDSIQPVVPAPAAPKAPQAPKAAAASQPVQIAGDADYEALPSGAEFIAPDGSRRRKP